MNEPCNDGDPATELAEVATLTRRRAGASGEIADMPIDFGVTMVMQPVERSGHPRHRPSPVVAAAT